MKKGWWKKLALWLVIVGGVNWGLVGLFNLNVITEILGNYPMLVRGIYDAVGVSAVIVLLEAVGVIKKSR